MQIDVSPFQPVDEIVGDDDEDAALLKAMASKANQYLRSFDWCPHIDRMYLGLGVGGIVAIFYVEFRKDADDVDDALWVAVGNIPSAYLTVQRDDTAVDALGRYCDMMDEWAFAVLNGRSLKSVFPVRADPTYDNAKSLAGRIAFIRVEVVNTVGTQRRSQK